jgi:hypothetical protein
VTAGANGPSDADGPGERQPTAEDGRPIARAFWVSVGVAGSVALTVFAWRWAMRPGAPAPVEPASVAGPAPARAHATAALPFEDVTEAWGIDFRRTDGADGRRLLPETMGGGVGVWDVDADGDLDLLFVDGDAWPDAPAGTARGQGIVVYVNRGRETTGPRFVRATDTGLGAPRQAMGLAMADLDGDGRPEILETGVGGIRLFAAEQASAGSPPRWRDVTRESGMSDVPGWTTAAGFADLDADGDLDVVLGRYVEWSAEIDFAVGYTLTGIGRAYGAPNGFRGTDVAFLEQVAPMRFEDRSTERGFVARNRSTGEPLSKSLGFVIDDVDSDGDLDVFVANDTVQNLLFVNDGRGRFAERGVESGTAFDRNGAATGAMGCDSSHLRNDRALAIAVGNFANEPASLYVTPGDGRFTDDAIVDGISAATRRALTFGVVFADLDGDGHEDLALANGHIEPRIAEVQASQSWAQPAQVFRNAGAGGGPAFAEVPAAALGAIARPMVGRGLAWGDLDGDGALDLVLAALRGAPMVARNAAAQGGTLAVRLDDPGSPGNRAAIGATLEVERDDRTVLRRTIMPTRSYLSQVPPVAWLGMGSTPARRITVRWPDGTTSVHAPPEGVRETVLVHPRHR